MREGDRNRAYFDGLVGFDHEHIASLRAALNRRRGDDRAVLADFEQQADIHELIRPERIVFVVKDRFQPVRSGGLVNLIVDREQFAGRQFGLIVTAVSIHLERALGHVLRDGRKVVFRQGEDDRDRLQLRNDEHGVGVGGMHNISRIDQPQPNRGRSPVT